MMHVLRKDEDSSCDQVGYKSLTVGVEDGVHQSATSFKVRPVLLFPPSLYKVLEELEHSRVGLLECKQNPYYFAKII